jgi:hypothetical protein
VTTSISLITPCLPPAVDGLGDYTVRLLEHWPEHCKPTISFLVLAGAGESKSLLNKYEIDTFERDILSLVSILNRNRSTWAFVQYVGYAYDPSGHPFWLVDALARWRSQSSGRKVAVMFHETWASGQLWEKAFWLKPAQRRCAAGLLALSDVAATSCAATLDDLHSVSPDRQIDLIPIGCNLIPARPKARNWRQALIFGKEPSRLRALKIHAALIRRLQSAGLIERLVLAGQSSASDCEEQKMLKSWGIVFDCYYDLPADGVPDAVAQCGISFMHTESRCLSKSGCFQVAARLGQVAITSGEEEPGYPLIRGRHYLNYRKKDFGLIEASLSQPATLEAISDDVAELGATVFSWQEIACGWQRLLAV